MTPERLSALDASFLYLERPNMHMHVAGLAVLDPSARPDGRLPFEEVRALLESRIHLAPKFRKRVMEVPGNISRPVWVDDERFDVDFHIRRAGLPSPGSRRQLADEVQRILSVPLDRSRPLWELYVFEGLDGGLAATLLKVHHALIDGIAAMHLAAALYDLTPEPSPLEPPAHWDPEPTPSVTDLVSDALREQLLHPVEAVVEAAETAMQAPALAAAKLGATVAGVKEVLGLGRRPSSPLDAEVGPNRRFAMADAPFARFKAIKDALGGTVNDVVLTVVAGALHELLKQRAEPTRGKTLRALVPVSVRSAGQRDLIGNRVAPTFVDIPVGTMKPERRLARVREATKHLKGSMMALGVDSIIGLGAFAPPALHSMAARVVSHGPWFNLVVSNIPGPQQPFYLAGARLLGNYPSMPLGENAALSIAVTSLCGTMAFGITADWDAVPDIDQLATAIEQAIDDLAKAAGV